MNMIKCALQIYIIQIKHNMLRIPTGGRLTSWLFTRRGGVEFGATEDKSIQWQGRGFEPGAYGLQVQRPTTRPLPLGTDRHLVTATILKLRKNGSGKARQQRGSKIGFCNPASRQPFRPYPAIPPHTQRSNGARVRSSPKNVRLTKS